MKQPITEEEEFEQLLFPILSNKDAKDLTLDTLSIPDMLTLVLHNQKVIFNKLKKIEKPMNPITEEEKWETPYGKTPEEKSLFTLRFFQIAVGIFLLGILAGIISIWYDTVHISTLRTSSFVSNQ